MLPSAGVTGTWPIKSALFGGSLGPGPTLDQRDRLGHHVVTRVRGGITAANVSRSFRLCIRGFGAVALHALPRRIPFFLQPPGAFC